jgi:hypothetical protein
MDHEIDKQEPSGTEGGEVKYKVGDSAWVLCEITGFDRRTGQVKVSGPYGGSFWTIASECRPVEPAPKETTPKEPTRGQRLAEQAMKAIWAANDSVNGTPVVKESLATKPNCPEIPDSSSDPIQVGDAVVIVERSHKWRGVRGRIVSVSESNEYPLEFISDCRKRLGCFRSSSIRKIGNADPINPSHYKQGGIECIEAIKAATGDGFIGYVWGNVLKYLWRWPKKGGVDDLKKARWYLDRLIKEVGE